MSSHDGETAFLTGGASGIGRAVTGMLVSHGVKVFVVDVDPAGLKAVEAESNTASAQHVWTSIVDVSDWDSQREAFETALQVFKGRIDYVFPIAGIGERRSFPNRPNSKGFEKPDLKVIEIDELGVIYTVSLAIQHFRRVQRSASGFKGKIVAVASVCGFYIHKPLPMYTAAKHAIVGLTRSLGAILQPEHITLNAVCPNKIRTNIGTASSYEIAEKAGVLCPMEWLLQAFEMLLWGEGKDWSGECLEVAPKLGVRKVEFVPFVNEESKRSAEITDARSMGLHEVVES